VGSYRLYYGRSYAGTNDNSYLIGVALDSLFSEPEPGSSSACLPNDQQIGGDNLNDPIEGGSKDRLVGTGHLGRHHNQIGAARLNVLASGESSVSAEKMIIQLDV
jgi:hypothetical protein